MDTTIKDAIAAALRVAADALDGGSSAVAPAARPGYTAIGLTALVRVVGPIVRIFEGRGTLADDAQAANAVMDAVALIDPKLAPSIATIELAEAAFVGIVGAFKSGAIHIEPGQNPIRGGWSGARGHI